MVLGHLRKDAREKRANGPGNEANRAGAFANVEQAQPQGHDAGQGQRNVHHRHFGGRERAINDALEHFGVAHEQPLRQSGGKADKEKPGPDVGKSHGACVYQRDV